MAMDADTSVFEMCGQIPRRLANEIKMDAVYEVHLHAYADNAAAVNFSCRIKAGKTLHDLTIEPCKDPRPRAAR
jgi:hypothetical protein